MSASTFRQINKSTFEHIKYGEPCPLPRVITQMLRESWFYIVQDNISQRLVQYLDDCHGNEEIVKNRRKVKTIREYIEKNSNSGLLNMISGGSIGDGFRIVTSDLDVMHSLETVVVTYPDHMNLIPCNSENKTILLMREAGCRPGYVNLEIFQIGDEEGSNSRFQKAVIPVGDLYVLSSDIYRQETVATISRATGADFVSNGPCTTLFLHGNAISLDLAFSFPCVCWPRVANEWKYRSRLHGWPSQTMIHRIVQGGCHLVPVGDKCSTDTLLQWRISFACAEQLLVHSLTHPQFRVYGLLKYFLYQIKDLLDHIIGDSDILCSYFLKTVIFYAVENSPHLLWDDQNTFICFRFCLSILIVWVKSSYCPNYFIRRNNMFLRKVHGENREKLLHFLIDLYYLNWMCLSIESVNTPNIGVMLQQHQSLKSIQHLECLRDLDLFRECLFRLTPVGNEKKKLYLSMKHLLEAKTDVDEFIAYCVMTTTLYEIACTLFNVYTNIKSNKQKYLALKKCKQLLARQASVCTSPGLMFLATFYYLTGDYKNTIRMCAEMTSTFKLYIGQSITETEESREQYQRFYCGQGYPLHKRFKEGVYSCLCFAQVSPSLCLPHLLPEVFKHIVVTIPPLAYARFLSFLCYHDLGDIRRRDTELTNLRAVNYDPVQGGHEYWIVHTLLGICYQTVGDNRRAIRSFTDSLRSIPDDNAAKERIEALRKSE
ncbi:uncharacterized protein LOC110447480 [Mizuhopecten yessoensis]|uniref:Cyclic GMP-AMP synthase n=1 Tax=Mizuhopecten yessoensis TaxID=6573 RepID=A0A210QV84_MIZYE|nr:uncharacterized protein LOC110447480 [Mizuhopecten yessoensis]OWF52649.1 Cyclic GMP-AMP synthase [Mizuhopecten yessoensis]